jgi:AcrR family transcriptional regulator
MAQGFRTINLTNRADASTDPLTERILDAAQAEFISFGLRRATLEDITKRAEVGRMTLHRRFPSKQALIEAVFARENSRIIATITQAADRHSSTVDRLVDGLASGIIATREHPLFARLVETDPEAIIPYFSVEAGPMMTEATKYVLSQLHSNATKQRPSANERRMAEAIVRLCHSILLTPDGASDLRGRQPLRKFLNPPIAAMVAAVDPRAATLALSV